MRELPDSATSVGFANPLEFLCGSHREIERYLSSLIRITEESRDGRIRERETFVRVLRQLSGIAFGHTVDEEESLFPRLRCTGRTEGEGALRRLETLEEEHGCADKAHGEVDRLARHWLASGQVPPAEANRLTALLTGLADLYRRHIQVEESDVFPQAARSLAPAVSAARTAKPSRVERSKGG